MPTTIYWIHSFPNSARIGIMARPRGDEWLNDEIIHLKRNNVQILVSLLDREEIYELGLSKEQQLCRESDIEYVSFPIADRSIPKQGNKEIDQLISRLSDAINQGSSIVIHCRMGIGRSSIIAASILLYYNFKAADAIHLICKTRGLNVPDTDEQLNWLRSRQ